MLEPELSSNIEAVVDCVRLRWREARDRAKSARIELFAKTSIRSRATRDVDGSGVTFDHARESGIAVRVSRAGHDHSGFAAASGLSSDSVRWAVDTAFTLCAQATSSAPDPSDSIEPERWDLDPSVAVPDELTLTGGLTSRPNLQWVEAGTTTEVLIGAEGWLAARRRHRVWALGGGGSPKLVAQRGFAGWEELVDASDRAEFAPSPSDSIDLGLVALTRDAASSVVAALVDAFHGPASVPSGECGHGWEVSDEPVRPDGLVGGSFDDAGFPSLSRALAGEGLWQGKLGGPGTLRRNSFRDPPSEAPSNLFIPSGKAESVPAHVAVARRCRVLQLSHELWVLELDFDNFSNRRDWERRWVRVRPRALVAACASRLGHTKATANGPIVPGLLFEGLVTE